MSLEVDRYLLEMMQREDDSELMLDTDVPGDIIDHLCGWNEETGTFQSDQGLLFPQPITEIE